MKFSIIIPVYNVEKYIRKCLDSVLSQSYKDFEVIVVNDGTKDSSQTIIDEFIKKDKRVKSFIKKNGGLSDARNFGLKYVTGEYIIFIDSDDYINKDLLLNLYEEIKKSSPDVIRYRYNICKNNSEKTVVHNCFSNLSKDEAIPLLLKDSVLEMAWSYCYKSSFWISNKFKFEKGKIHEDYGLIPYILTKANVISSIDYVGYNYIIREGSIMTSIDEEKNYKKAMDVLDQCIKNLNRIDTNSYSNKLICSFFANGVINIISLVPKNKKKEFCNLVIKNKIINYILDDSLKRKIKKIYIKIMLKLKSN